ncbi:MAG: FHA domain-containing protein, partial [Gammaproteobacteria bacterium]
DNQPVQEIPLDKQDMTIGRSPDNEIPVDDQAASRRHVRIITILNDSFLEDLNSTNGTYVNGKLTKKSALSDGDLVLVGRHQFKYVADVAAGDDDDDMNKTQVIAPGTMGASAPRPPVQEPSHSDTTGGMVVEEGSDEAARVAAVEGYGGMDEPEAIPATARLEVMNGTHAGKSLNLDKAMTNIGRAGQQVAAISRRPNGFFLIHVESAGGGVVPQVNGQPLPANGQQLVPEDVVEIGGIRMQFFYV